MNDTLLDFKTTVDEEIQAYEELGDLYKIKQSALVHQQLEELWDIDSKILEKTELIKRINTKRRELAKYLGNENITLSEIIEKIKETDKDLAENFKTQKTKIGVLSKAIKLQEKTISALIKHGLAMVESTMNIILSAVVPQKQQYDKSGHNIRSDENLISSIIEEA